MAQLPVAFAQNIFPDRVSSGHVTDVSSGHVTDVTSGHVTFGHAQWFDPPHDPPQIRLCPSPYTTPLVKKEFNINKKYK
jgi:hypothetical protein